MSDDKTDGDYSGGLYTRGEGELYEDGHDYIDDQGNDSIAGRNAPNGNQDQQHKHEMSKEQMMDQATEKKGTIRSEAAETLGVSWAEGAYSGKNLRSRCLLVWVVTAFFIFLSVVVWRNGHAGTVVLGLLAIIPACAWVWFGCIYIYRTKTIRYRLTQHRFYNEEGLFTKSVDTLELINIEDMTLRQTLVDRLINGGTGTIILMSNDQSHPTLKISGLENPRAAFESIDELRRRERNARVIRSVN